MFMETVYYQKKPLKSVLKKNYSKKMQKNLWDNIHSKKQFQNDIQMDVFM